MHQNKLQNIGMFAIVSLLAFVALFHNAKVQNSVPEAEAHHCAPIEVTASNYWSADSVDTDLIGTDDGTNNGVTYVSGKVANAWDFDGGLDYMAFSETFPFHEAGDKTMEFWVNIDSGSSESIFWTRTDNSDTNRFNIGLSGSTAVFIDYRNPSAGLHVLGSWTGLTHDTWHHLALVRTVDDPSAGQHTYTRYVDGQLNGSTTDASPNLPNAVGWELAGRAGLEFNGFMDELTFYDSALSQSQIQAIYDADTAGKCFNLSCGDSTLNAGEDCDDGNTAQGDGCSETCQFECYAEPANLVSWYKGEDNPFDYKSTNDGVQSDVTFVNAKVDKGIDFTGSSPSGILKTSATGAQGLTELTMMGWIRVDGSEGTTRNITWLQDDDIETWGTFLQLSPDNELRLGVNDSTYSSWPHIYSTSTITNTGNFVHVAGTWKRNSNDANDFKVYINGTDDTDVASFGTNGINASMQVNSATWSLGYREYSVGDVNYFNGVIDEVMIFDRQLSAAEIAAIYTADTEGVCAAACGASGDDDPSTCLGADNAAPSITVATDDSSTEASPTTGGTPVTFTATATDANSDNYYLIVCADGDTVTPNVSAAPSCSSSQICVSSSTATGVQATCNSTNVSTPPISVEWESFVCDHSADSKCSSTTEATNSPYYVNSQPDLAAIIEGDANLTNGATFASGLSGQAFSFDGTDDYIDVSPGLGNLSLFTVSAWIKTTDTLGEIIMDGSSTNTFPWYDLAVVDGKLYSYIRGNVAGNIEVKTNAAVNDGEWHHVAAVRTSSSNVDLYIDGVEGTYETAVYNTPAAGTFDLGTIGAYRRSGTINGGNFFDGEIDDLQLYTSALTSDQIKAIYEARSGGICEVTTGCTGLPSGAIAWYDAEGDFDDNVGTYNGTANGDAAATGTGKVGDNAFTFDGTGDYVSISHDDALQPTTAISVSAWVKLNDPSDLTLIVDKSHGWTDSTGWGMQVDAGGLVSFFSGNGTGFVGSASTTNVYDNTWHHILGTIDTVTDTSVIYIDGVQEDTDAYTGSLATNTRNVNIGASWGGGTFNRHANGLIDEVMIFDRALTATEAAAIHAADSNGICTNLCAIDNSLVAWYSGDNDATDRKHFNDGTFNGNATVTSSSGGKINEAFTFDGTGDYITVTHDDALQADDMSVMAWVKLNNNADFSTIVEKSHGGGDNKGWAVTALSGGTVNWSVGDDAGFPTASSTTAVYDNTWHHVAATLDSTANELKIYIDGTLEDTEPFTGTYATNTRTVNIGAWWGGGTFSRFSDGLIDEVMFFDRTLSAQEISNMYTAQNAGTFTGTCYESCLEEPANLVSHWQGDFDTKDSEGSNDGDATFGSIEPGEAIHFYANVTDADLAGGGSNSVNMAICSDGSTFGTPAAPCSGTLICDAQHQRPGTLVCDSSSETAIPKAHGITNYEIFAWDEQDTQASYTASSAQSYSVTDVTPSIDSFTMNGGAGDFTPDLNGSTKSYSWAAIVTDGNGDGDLDQASESGKFYDTNASQTSSCDESTTTNANAQQECYADADCDFGSTIDGDESATVTCTFDTYFNINASAGWEGYLTISDDGANNVTGDSNTVSAAQQTVLASTVIDVRDAADSTLGLINYGSIQPGANSGTLNQAIFLANIGNSAFDTNIYGSDMCDSWGTPYSSCSGNSIGVANQEFSEAAGTSYSSGTDLAVQASQACVNNTLAVRTINDQNDINDPIYFGIGLPSALPTGTYTGQNTFAATAASTTCD